MSYDYQQERSSIFTETGVTALLKMRDNIRHLLQVAGAFRATEATEGITGDTFLMIACLDYLVEIGEIVCVRSDCWAQFRVFSTQEVGER